MADGTGLADIVFGAEVAKRFGMQHRLQTCLLHAASVETSVATCAGFPDMVFRAEYCASACANARMHAMDTRRRMRMA